MTIHRPATDSSNIHIPGKSAVDNSCVYPLASSTNSSTNRQLMQLVLGLAIGMFLSGQAVAEVQKGDFFDFEEAQRIWATVRTHDAFEAYKASNCPAWGVMSKWESQYNKDPKAALEALKQHPQADKIRRCYNFKLVGYVQSRITAYWEFGGNDCAEVAKYNMFTHRCDDVPDWRIPAQVKRDQRRLEKSKQTLRIYGK